MSTDDQSSQATLGTSNSTIGESSLTNYVILDRHDYASSTDSNDHTSVPTTTNDANEDNGFDTSNNNSDDDPLEVRRLALTFDYLMYKIQDHVTGLSDAVTQNVDYTKKQRQLELSQINRDIHDARKLISECNCINLEIDKLEQLQLMTRDFKERLTVIDSRTKTHDRKFSK
ncbi:hypothetical protein FOA43_003708 [Brettanomyces nanus]|uniref:Biogenesis of lysosome-related organelles complex 1 subunit CNL1 n=1 Tax=Eeniella nana TaxID=13502 RepID=A0A875S8X1_EENNA|nr:uncharacterized protein FOA43_003708 [Brettanomyces nanus]QPG76322.1 hypothetical protein FOA43_003708 [Brettanomyces nanus]